MKINRSPWIHQLDKERRTHILKKDIDTDVAIVGAGIAGISTAFFILKYTDKNVAIIEKSKLAHGATGHNAGQIVTYFERPFYDIVREYGLEKATDAQAAIESAWKLMDDMYTEANLNIPFSKFIGYDGYSTFERVLENLKDDLCRKQGGLVAHGTLISKNAEWVSKIPTEYKEVYKIVNHEEILKLLETENKEFIAVSMEQKGVINSALFCQEIGAYLLNRYPERFKIYEHTPIYKIVLKEHFANLDASTHVVTCKKVILCTNGFENVSIINRIGLNIDTKFHHELTGIVARMSGYLENPNKDPIAISYYVKPGGQFDNMDDPYFYLTRRAYEYEQGKHHNLICVGGPQHSIADREEYLYEFDYPEEVQLEIDEFVRKTYDPDPNRKIEYQFTWHGLMGYTTNRIRLVGSEPLNPILMYNLGCNGVGILPSIFGGKRIADMIDGKKTKPMIFDPVREKGRD